MHKEGSYLVETPIHGLVAEFSDPNDLVDAANATREAGYRRIDAYSPFPIHGLAEAIGFDDGRVPWFAFFGGLAGFSIGFGILYYTCVVDYPWNVGGKPLLSWPQFLPIIYECTILISGITAFASQFLLNGLPRPYNSIFNARNFERASQDKFFLCIEAADARFDLDETARFLRGLGADQVSTVEK